MKFAIQISIVLLIMGSFIWVVLNARWESTYVVQEEYGGHTYIMRLAPSPLWAKPPLPSFEEFDDHFSSSALNQGGRITVHNKWSWWILDLFSIWLIASGFITPILLIFYRKHKTLGVFARVGVGLIISASVCFLLWLSIGGWGPPSPLLFGILGLTGGGIWAFRFHEKIKSEQDI